LRFEDGFEEIDDEEEDKDALQSSIKFPIGELSVSFFVGLLMCKSIRKLRDSSQWRRGMIVDVEIIDVIDLTTISRSSYCVLDLVYTPWSKLSIMLRRVVWFASSKMTGVKAVKSREESAVLRGLPDLRTCVKKRRRYFCVAETSVVGN